MKKFLTLLLIALSAFSLSSCTLTRHANEEVLSYFSFSIQYDSESKDNASTSSSEEVTSSVSSEEVNSSVSSEEVSSSVSSEEVSSSESSEEVPVPPSLLEDGADLATCAPFISRAPERYGALCTLSTQNTETYGSSYALKGVFNNKGTYPYQEYQVWTWASLCLEEWYGNAVNLKGKCLTYDVKAENCGLYSSFIVMAPNGQRTTEVSFSLADPTNAYPGITCKALSNGWYRVTIDFTKAYGDYSILNDAMNNRSRQGMSNPSFAREYVANRYFFFPARISSRACSLSALPFFEVIFPLIMVA